MKIVIIGGKLQGVEASYLAKKAGWEVVIVDKNDFVPAKGLCDKFYQLDILDCGEKFLKLIKNADLIIPAIEDKLTLDYLDQIAKNNGFPLAFQAFSYDITSSKRQSNNLFMEHDIPIPKYFPKCNLPLIIKPSDSSGSQGVRKVRTVKELSEYLTESNLNEVNWIIQEYVEGQIYSLEVIGCQGKFITYQITDLEMDNNYDCKRVAAPSKLIPNLETQLRKMTEKIAKLINLNGIMDIEVVNHNGDLKVLEIDARLPSQTPTVVFKSTGINFLEELYKVYVQKSVDKPDITPKKAVIYEHICVTKEVIKTLGEHIIATASSLKLKKDFFGADEALTNYVRGCTSWVATLIVTESNFSKAWEKRSKVIENIQKHCHVDTYLDPIP